MSDKILDYYTEQNFTTITLKIIEAYRNKKYSYIIGLGKIIDENIFDKHRNIQKLFSHLIMLFHPDRLNLYRKDISALIQQNKSNELQKYYAIIPVLENLENMSYHRLNSKLELEIEYEYGYDKEDFDSIIGQSEFDKTHTDEENYNYEFDFISLLRFRELGSIDDELPSFYFEELEGDLILSESNLFDLSGLELCSNIKSLDLSNNQIIDIHQIGFLAQIQELNLSGNKIQDIDVLNNLKNLKKIDLSFNEVESVLSLLNLPKLEYLNVIGNNISQKQRDIFKKQRILFVY